MAVGLILTLVQVMLLPSDFEAHPTLAHPLAIGRVSNWECDMVTAIPGGGLMLIPSRLAVTAAGQLILTY